jgi:hypothetical protein
MKENLIRESLVECESEFSRRGFLRTLVRGAGIAAAFDNFGPRLFADNSSLSLPYQVFGSLGRLVIPVDEDPGWETFEPGITTFGVDVFVRNVLLNGNYLAFLGFLSCLTAVNNIPVQTTYGPRFLEMLVGQQFQYFSDILTGRFENDGFGDLVGFAGGLSLIATKGTFFSNYPLHLPNVDDNGKNTEFQVRPAHSVKTGWDIMQLKGPVGPAEEAALRARYTGIQEIPGVDPSNPYI